MGIGIKTTQHVVSDAIFLTGHGSDDVVSVSVLSVDPTGSPVGRIRAGQILIKLESEKGFVPILLTRLAKEASNTNKITVWDASLFKPGMIVEIDQEFRSVSGVSLINNELLLSGDPITKPKDTPVLRCRSYNATVVEEAVSKGSSGKTTIKVSNARLLSRSKKASIGKKEYPIESVDQAANSITITGDIAAAVGDVVVGDIPTFFKIAKVGVETRDQQNVLVPTQDHGRVRTQALVGFLPEFAEKFPHIIFDNRTL